MTDPSQLTNAQLLAIIGGQPQQPSAPRPAQPRPQSGVSRGERNANQGNIKDSPFARRQPGYAGSDGTFARFNTPEAGNAAQVALLANNYIGAGFDTPAAIVNRYAPPGPENSPESVRNYTNYVAASLGIGPNDRVSPQQAEALAQAMREFETGNTRSMGAQGQTADSDLTQMGDEELLALANGVDPLNLHQPENIDVNALVNTQNDFGVPASQYTQATPFVAIDETTLTPEQVADYRRSAAGIRKGDYIQLPDGSIQRASSDAYAEENPDRAGSVSQGGGLYTRAPNLGDRISAFGTGAGEQIPFLDEAATAAVAGLEGRSFSDVRDDYRQMVDLQNQSYRGERIAGGITGAATGLVAPGSGFVKGGATALNRGLRAAGVGAGYGSVYGAGAAEGGIDERLRAGAEGAAIGGLTGGVLQSGVDRLARGRANPTSAARRLSREGVQLTPGQMMQELPVVGPVAKWTEDLASGYIPFIGGARERSAESLARAVGNRSLEPIGGTVSEGARTGYEIASDVYKRLGDAYDEVLPRVNAQADTEVLTDLSGLLNRAADDLPADQMARLERVLDQGVIDRFTSGGVLSGDEFKRIETRLREMSQRYQRGTVDDGILADYFDETRDVIRNLIARTNPAEAEKIQNINRGYANYARLRRAVSRPAAQGREGTFTPGELSSAVSQLGTENQLATRSALMQDLSADARNILPSSMGDTGSGQRAVVGAAALGGGALVNAPAAIGVGVSSLLYTKPVQSALNAVYRATDSRVANEGMQTLLEAARRDPAMVPVYQSALDHLRGEGGQAPSQAPLPDVLSQAQAGMTMP